VASSLAAEPLLALAVTVTSEQHVGSVLLNIVQGLASQPGVALARIWLVPSAVPPRFCHSVSDPADHLCLVASAGTPINSPEEDWCFLQGHFARVPFNVGKIGQVAASRHPILVEDVVAQNDWIVRPQWAKREKIRSFAGHPLIFRDKLLGVIAVFSRQPFGQQEFTWLGLFSNQAAIAIANASVEEALQSNERNLSLTINTMPVMAWSARPDGSLEFLNRRWLDFTGLSVEEARGWGWTAAIHPDDLNRLTDYWRAIRGTGEKGEIEARLRRFDGEYRWCLIRACTLRDESGEIVKWYGTNTDIDDRKRAEEKLRQSEEELRAITDTVRQPIVVLSPDGFTLYANRVALENTGLTLDEVIKEGFLKRACDPDDINRVLLDERRVGLLKGAPFDLEMRLLRKSGQYRWHLMQYNPLKDEGGQIVRWYVTATDIDDRKKAEKRLRHENVKLARENVYLEEQIRSEMGFEQIIGSSPALKHVLELVETVAPNDSTVLLLGETGTGKELIAREIHKLSRRKAKTFVKLNCAAIPTGLLESELFGHEKGSFTGAIIQKVGRMELADQGTLFLDEVGDIPIDIQPKLLRALQEKEFERLGSTHTRKVNLRLVAATNRNLERMIIDREFRSDLFYRLNVFPIRIPPLRDRKDDIPLLVVYFVQKFAKQMQKRIDSIPVATMKALTAWEWPGNIRELENFIERAVILTRGESLAAPLAELRNVSTDEPVRQSAPKADEDIARIVRETITSLKSKATPNGRTKKQRDEIVRVLTECKGRVGGSDGAAVRMGLNRTTLMYRMKKLGIDPDDYA
jgi:formate hydrogenlyase transcriptional activator